MTNYEFGEMLYGHCNVAEVRREILKSMEGSGAPCDAALGFVATMREMRTKSLAVENFLRKFDSMFQVLDAFSKVKEREE